jgi:hypothetical protein
MPGSPTNSDGRRIAWVAYHVLERFKTMKIRLLALVLVLAGLPGFQGLARASYDYSSVINPGTVNSLSGASTETFDSAYGGPTAVDGSTHQIALTLISATSTSATPEALLSTTMTDTLSITDGGLVGVFTITATAAGVGIDGADAGTYRITDMSLQSSSIVVNNDTYQLSDFVYTAPVTNGSSGEITAMLSATPGAVPEPSSLMLMGLGGVLAWVTARRSFIRPAGTSCRSGE